MSEMFQELLLQRRHPTVNISRVRSAHRVIIQMARTYSVPDRDEALGFERTMELYSATKPMENTTSQ